MSVEYNSLNIKQLFFNSLQLLGFDVPAKEATNHIPFNKDMFDLPNKRGAEIVLYFLFERLNPILCRETFRDCWPILDKKRDQGFRKACATWLMNISHEEPDSHLPHINAALFMSPGGDKFYQLLFYFSGYVLQKVLETELDCKPSERLRYTSLTSQNLPLADSIGKTLICNSIRHRREYFSSIQLNVKANKIWKEAADEFVKEYRKLNKEVRELDYKIREEEQKSVQAAVTRGSPVRKHSQPEHFDSLYDPKTIKRSQRIQQVRDMWKQLEDFDRTEAAEREVIESIVEKTINKLKLDAADIRIMVPDMLLRECGDEVRRRNVDNTYQGGKLNIVSVLQLWNLCLHLYLEKIHKVGVPKFEDDIQKMTSQVHIQQNYAQNAHALRTQMSETIPMLKSSIEKLREKLDSQLFKDLSPTSIRTTSCGLGLVGPSPVQSFSPTAGDTPPEAIGVPKETSAVETPEAAMQIREHITASARRGLDQLFKEPDLLRKQMPAEQSAIPQPVKSGCSTNSRPNSARSSTSNRGETSRTSSTSGKKPNDIPAYEPAFAKITTPRTMMEKLQLGDSMNDVSHSNSSSRPTSARSDRSVSSSTLSARSQTTSSSMIEKLVPGDSLEAASYSRSSLQPTSARSYTSASSLSARPQKSDVFERSTSSRSQYSDVKSGSRSQEDGINVAIETTDVKKTGRKTPTDYLVEEIMGEGKILSPFNSGMEAFESRHVIRRTPDLCNDSRDSLTPTNECQEDLTPQADNVEKCRDTLNDVDELNDSNENKENIAPSLDDDFSNDRAASNFPDIASNVYFKESRVIEEKDNDENASFDDLQNLTGITDKLLNDLVEEGVRRAEDGYEEDADKFEDKDNLGNKLDRSALGYLSSQGDMFIGKHIHVVYDQDNDLFGMEGSHAFHGSEQEKDFCNGGQEQYVEQFNRNFSDVDNEDADGGFQEIRGPELIEDTDDECEGSLYSTEQVIVIDRSLHLVSPEHQESSKLVEFSPPGTPDLLIDEEQFPSLENSPREAIIIDRSFQHTSTKTEEASPPWKEFLSHSLVVERKPLSEEIRKMFKQALADTPLSQDMKKSLRSTMQQSESAMEPKTNTNLFSEGHVKNSHTRLKHKSFTQSLINLNNQYSDDNRQSFQGTSFTADDILWSLPDNRNLAESDLAAGDGSRVELEPVEINESGDTEIVLDMLDLKDVEIGDFFKTKTPELPKRTKIVMTQGQPTL